MSNTRRRAGSATNTRGTTGRGAGSPASRWPRRIAQIAGVLVVAGLLAVILLDTDSASGIPPGTVESPGADRSHIDGAISYDVSIPPGGAHNAVWQNCGFYDTPIRPENAVHSLEHGVAWLTYRSDVDDVGALERIARQRPKVLVSPNEDQASPLLLTAWGLQLEVESVSDPRVDQFINEVLSGRHAPESFASCNGGVGTPVG